MYDERSKARNIVACALALSTDVVGDDASIDTLDEWDSMGHLRIVFEIENKLGIELEAEQIIAIESVDDVARLLQELQPVLDGKRS